MYDSTTFPTSDQLAGRTPPVRAWELFQEGWPQQRIAEALGVRSSDQDRHRVRPATPLAWARTGVPAFLSSSPRLPRLGATPLPGRE
jgi:hypothetical protein